MTDAKGNRLRLMTEIMDTATDGSRKREQNDDVTEINPQKKTPHRSEGKRY